MKKILTKFGLLCAFALFASEKIFSETRMKETVFFMATSIP